MGVQRFGDFDKARKLLGNLNTNLIVAEQRILATVAAKAEQLAVDRIKEQPSEWKVLSPSYYQWKISKGYSDKILIKTSSYFQAITSGTVGLIAYAGVPKTAKNKQGESIANIAAVHEYGSVKRNIPARPVWQVVQNEIVKFVLTSPSIPNHVRKALL